MGISGAKEKMKEAQKFLIYVFFNEILSHSSYMISCACNPFMI
jgi:hypothetical protein